MEEEENDGVMRPRDQAGFTWIELLVVLVIVLVLLALALPGGTSGSGLTHASPTQALLNMNQLYRATKQMEIDGVEESPTSGVWPGDLDGSMARWAQQLRAGISKHK